MKSSNISWKWANTSKGLPNDFQMKWKILQNLKLRLWLTESNLYFSLRPDDAFNISGSVVAYYDKYNSCSPCPASVWWLLKSWLPLQSMLARLLLSLYLSTFWSHFFLSLSFPLIYLDRALSFCDYVLLWLTVSFWWESMTVSQLSSHCTVQAIKWM